MPKKILFLPFLQMASGHHQTADALRAYVRMCDPAAECRKVDILQYSYGVVESWVSRIYLNWIHAYPDSYHWVYRKSAARERSRTFRTFSLLFLGAMRKLLEEERPDLVFCTHALPSFLLDQLKQDGFANIPVVNVYTDFFINDLWGTRNIDFHFVPDRELKQRLIDRGVPSSRQMVTGIPVHPSITPTETRKRAIHNSCSVLLSGGSLGVGRVEELVHSLDGSGSLRYWILCGRNRRLYARLADWNHPSFEPVPYLSCRKEMNRLYEQADAVLTKPGGVTISECLLKKKPVFVYGALPGQETFNLEHLKKHGLVWDVAEWEKAADGCGPDVLIKKVLESNAELNEWERRVDTYLDPSRHADLKKVIRAFL